MNAWLIAELPKIVMTHGKRMVTTVVLPAGDGHPVIVYPGFTTGNKAMAPLRDALAMAGHNTIPWDHERNNGMNEELFVKLVKQVDDLHEEYGVPVSIVGHSLGGTIARAVANMRPDSVRRVIAVASPINGIDKALDKLRPTYDKINGTNTTDEHWNQYRDIITQKPTIPCTSIFSKTDGLVRPGMSKLLHEPLSTNILVQGGGHFSMVIDPNVIQLVATELLRV